MFPRFLSLAFGASLARGITLERESAPTVHSTKEPELFHKKGDAVGTIRLRVTLKIDGEPSEFTSDAISWSPEMGRLSGDLVLTNKDGDVVDYNAGSTKDGDHNNGRYSIRPRASQGDAHRYIELRKASGANPDPAEVRELATEDPTDTSKLIKYIIANLWLGNTAPSFKNPQSISFGLPDTDERRTITDVAAIMLRSPRKELPPFTYVLGQKHDGGQMTSPGLVRLQKGRAGHDEDVVFIGGDGAPYDG